MTRDGNLALRGGRGLRTRALTTSARALTGVYTDPILAPVLVSMARGAAFAVRSGMARLPDGLTTFANATFSNTTIDHTIFGNTSGRPPLHATTTPRCRTKRVLVLLDFKNTLKRFGSMRRQTTHGRTRVPVPSRALTTRSHRGGVRAMVDLHGGR